MKFIDQLLAAVLVGIARQGFDLWNDGFHLDFQGIGWCLSEEVRAALVLYFPDRTVIFEGSKLYPQKELIVWLP